MSKATKRTKRFYVGTRAERGVERKHLHVLLNDKEHQKLVRLTQRWQKTAADVVRALIVEAK